MEKIIKALEEKIKDCENAIALGAGHTSSAMKFAYTEALALIKQAEAEQ